MPEAVRLIGSYAPGECDWKQHCLKKFVTEGAQIALSYGINPTRFMREHPLGQVVGGHWHEFCGWRNGGLRGDVDCQVCLKITQRWTPPVQRGNWVQDANAPPLQAIANALPLQDADAPPLQDAHAPPLEDGTAPITPRKAATKHVLPTTASPDDSRAKAKAKMGRETLLCEDLEAWLLENRTGAYEWLPAKGSAPQRVICLVCLDFEENNPFTSKIEKKRVLAESRCGFEVCRNSLQAIKRHEVTKKHPKALAYRNTLPPATRRSISTSSSHPQWQASSSQSQSSHSHWQESSSQSQSSEQLVLKSRSLTLEELKDKVCVGVDLAQAGSTTRAAQVHYISPPPNIISTTIHTQCVPTFQHSNISQQSIPVVAMKVCSLTRCPTNM